MNQQLKTPCFVWDETILHNELQSLKTALRQYWSNHLIAYSVKTNSLPALGQWLQAQGIGAEVVSHDEYNLIQTLGYSADDIVCNGPIKSQEWIEKILVAGNRLNIDSPQEIAYISHFAQTHPNQSISVGIRINLDIEHFFAGESKGGNEGSRFGLSEDSGDLQRAISQLQECKNITISGLHLHISTQSRTTDIYRWITQEFVRIVQTYQLDDIRYFDIGGGFCGGLPTLPTWQNYLQVISTELRAHHFSPSTLQLIVEPGVSLLAGCFSYITKVIDIKTIRNKRIIITDGSRTHIDPLFHKEKYFYEVVHQTESKDIIPYQQLCGFTCLEFDRFFTLENQIALQRGDNIYFHKVGAYTLTLSPMFISLSPTPVYLKRKDGSMLLVRDKWTTNDFLTKSNIKL